jgi:flagellar biosynthesis protein FlhF
MPMSAVTGSQGLHLKSYFAGSIEAALDQARRELGREALLVDSRKAPREAQHLGRYEVVFAMAPSPKPAAWPGQTGSAAMDSGISPEGLEGLSRLLDEKLDKLILQAGLTPRHGAASPVLPEEHSALLAAEVDEQLAREIVDSANARISARSVSEIGRGTGRIPPRDPELVRQQLVAEIESRFSVNSVMGAEAGGKRAVALVGPPGAGKTTTLVKLAVARGLALKKPVELITMDTHRIGAAEQLRSYAGILGVGFLALETGLSLEQAIEEHRGKDLILIDTPGFSVANIGDAADLARCLSSHPGIDVHLVLPSSMKPADLARCASAFEIFRPAKLLFTKLDETQSFGPLFCQAARMGIPVSYFSTGQSIPEDLEAATQARIADSLLQLRAKRVTTAA